MGGKTVCLCLCCIMSNSLLDPVLSLLHINTGSPRSHKIFCHSVEHRPLDPDGIQFCKDRWERWSLRHHCWRNTGNHLLCWRGVYHDPEPNYFYFDYFLLIKVMYVQSLKPVSNTVKSYDDKQQMSSQHPLQNPRAIFNSFCYIFWNLLYVLKYLYCLLI